jgi:hypothetical protein
MCEIETSHTMVSKWCIQRIDQSIEKDLHFKMRISRVTTTSSNIHDALRVESQSYMHRQFLAL